MYLCIHQQNHFSDQTNTHKTVCEGSFVYLCIGVFTNKITALRVPTRRCDLVVPVDGGWGRSNTDSWVWPWLSRHPFSQYNPTHGSTRFDVWAGGGFSSSTPMYQATGVGYSNCSALRDESFFYSKLTNKLYNSLTKLNHGVRRTVAASHCYLPCPPQA